jgi:elongator complex protein 3
VSIKQDLEGLRRLFGDPSYRPDMLKIYPCMVMKGTNLYGLWKKGLYRPLSTKEAARLIASFKASVPRYCRIMRVQRDIPSYMASAGVDRTNLRQYIQQIMQAQGTLCECIRCREIGRRKALGRPRINVLEYEASKGTEFFISADQGDSILGFCRLRLPSDCLRDEITPNSALVRELHVYGMATGIGERGDVQHRGIGRMLLRKAEHIAAGNGKDKLVVISGIGARGYYRKLGYRRQGPYMVRKVA